MSTLGALRLATYLLVCDGIVALYLGGLIGPLGTALIGIALAGHCWHERVRARIAVRPGFTRGLVAVAAVACGVDLIFLAQGALDGMVHLLLFLILLRLFRGRSRRDLRDAGFLSFFLLVAASSVTFGVGFLFVFIAFLAIGTWMLMLHHVASEVEGAAGRGPDAVARAGLARPLLTLSLGACAATMAIATGLFFVIPRIGQAALPFGTRMGPMVSGFSDRVELGAFGQIEMDETVIMRVHFTDGTPSPEHLPNLRWRGIVFDRFDGRAWTVGEPQRLSMRRSLAGEFDISPPLRRGPVVTYEVYLEPIGTEIIFAAPQLLRLGLRAGSVTLDDMGSVSVPTPSARLHYVAESELEGMGAGIGTGSAAARFGSRASARYLQLPPIADRIQALARQVTAGSRDPYEAAIKLTGFLSREFRYTLALERKTTLDPVEEFLFVRRSGNCEYFAASLAVMLRSLGIPARVVSGFQRGEWNRYGRYFMVRLRDAHSWVEAYIGGPVGWVTLDPSPRGDAEAAAAPGPLRMYLDALRMRWYRYVINWSLRDQMVAAVTIRQQASTWKPWLGGRLDWAGVPRWTLVTAVLSAAAVGLTLWRGGKPRRSRAQLAQIPGFYARALRALARRGLHPEPGETAREFSARVEGAEPSLGDPVARLTAQYERCRFGAGALTAGDAEELDTCLTALHRHRHRAR